jgi:hypothetical protein
VVEGSTKNSLPIDRSNRDRRGLVCITGIMRESRDIEILQLLIIDIDEDIIDGLKPGRKDLRFWLVSSLK